MAKRKKILTYLLIYIVYMFFTKIRTEISVMFSNNYFTIFSNITLSKCSGSHNLLHFLKSLVEFSWTIFLPSSFNKLCIRIVLSLMLMSDLSLRTLNPISGWNPQQLRTLVTYFLLCESKKQAISRNIFKGELLWFIIYQDYLTVVYAKIL